MTQSVKVESVPMEMLKAEANPFGGIVITHEHLDMTPEQFRKRLAYSLSVWQREGFKVVWVEMPIHLSALIPAAVDAGFTFHHSSEKTLMLTQRLEEGAFIPPFATHYIVATRAVLTGNCPEGHLRQVNISSRVLCAKFLKRRVYVPSLRYWSVSVIGMATVMESRTSILSVVSRH
ncbi:hypothetical protein KFU94_66015 [Chloroflexi bacterium TSY]|nr:hypothetical protein [Chloroflexi bacterium TSY]